MITSAPESLALHERAVDQMWSRALRGGAASAYLRSLMEAVSESADVEAHHAATGPKPKLVHRSVADPATADVSKRCDTGDAMQPYRFARSLLGFDNVIT